MDTERILEPCTKFKRKLADGFLEFLHDDLTSCKYLKAAAGDESQPVENSRQDSAREGNSHRILVQQDALNFHRSGVPSRFLYYDKGHWRDFSQDVIPSIVESFVARKSSTRFSVQTKVYVLNFVYMIQLNLRTGFARSIAWIDRSGGWFTPSKCIEQSCTGLLLKLIDGKDSLAMEATRDDAKLRNFDCGLFKVRIETSTHGLTTNCDDFTRLGDKLIKLAENEQDFSFARDKFLSGFSLFAKDATITGIYRNSHTSISGQARLEAFNIQERIITASSGDANIRHAWHGTSKEGVLGIIRHGFGQPRVPKNGDTFGVGVYLAPEDSSHVSAMYSDVDENGEQHIVLCKVIMGRMEQVLPGSQQFHPSSEDFDTGVDDLTRPKRYIVWSTHMNTHILPLFVISFKLSTIARALIIAAQRGKQAFKESASFAMYPKRDHPSVSMSSLSHCDRRGQYRELFERVEHHLPEMQADSCTSTVCDLKAAAPSPSRVEESASSSPKLNENTFTNACSHRNVPRSPWISIPELFPLLESKLEPQALKVLQKLHLKFQVGRLPRNLFVKMLRRMLGDDFLRECIKNRSVQTVSTCDTHSFCG
ncbi:hypothetical protein GOP47_0011179 [Adiantum capillus-veneris]|uniref:Poly [ADP-ribose] polymerase n=1 Tax=Adiantum capillus-veneris TaxID=13818 RepID=A0A9D4ZHL4_ADICA|nr:hypothetical protein GOP47_0011179 [Adiantum capillus-veneris]